MSGDITEEIRKCSGGVNDFPPHWREITEAEFARSEFFFHTPVFLEYRQMLPEDPKESVVCATLYHLSPGWGFSIVNEFWENKVRFFAFGCPHSWKELNPEQAREEGITHFGMCDHVYKCKKCGATRAEDSSG